MTVEPRYETFITDEQPLHSGRDVPLVLRDLQPGRRKYLARHVVARVTRVELAPPGAVPLRVRSRVGVELPGPWWIEVRRALPARLPGAPYSSAPVALNRLAEPGSDAEDEGPSAPEP